MSVLDMKLVNPQEMSKEQMVNHLRQMMSGIGWAVLLHHWSALRERKIREAIDSRADEKGKKMLAYLGGFQEAVELPEKLIRSAGTANVPEPPTED